MTASLYVDSSDSRLAGDQKVIRYKCYIMHLPIKNANKKKFLYLLVFQ